MAARDDWRTPVRFLEAARATMDGIDLDPASSDEAQQDVQAEAYFTREDNGLVQPWYGRIWLNPPYSQTGRWVNYLAEQIRLGNTTEAIALLPSFKSDSWQDKAIGISDLICFSSKRIQFYAPLGVWASQNNNGSVILYRGLYESNFIRHFSHFGPILQEHLL